MANALDKAMQSPQTAIGKGKVGEPSPAAAGKTGVTVRVFIIFDGTKNNRTNTAKRLNDPTDRLLKMKGMGSSYANFYSNPAIHEFMNKRNDRTKYEVSLYVEGIGTEDFSDEAQAAGLPDKKNGNDQMLGNAFGAGTTGVREKVVKGINKLHEEIKKLYKPEREYIEKIIVDTCGFSRGAAAARHFVFRRGFLRGPWPGGSRPELVINFVALYDTVSSFARQGHSYPSILGHFATHGLNTDKLFCDDVQELGLNLGDTPKQVVHLTAGDEHRQNFSLTTINTSLAAGVGVELRLPGVHSDIGGAYAERDPANPTLDPSRPVRELNQESRRIVGAAEQQRLLAEGWYTPEQLQRRGTGWGPREQVTGVRYLSNEYQYLTLRLMHRFALGQLGGNHEPLDLADFTEADFATYQVPAPLLALAVYFEGQARGKGRQPVAPDEARYPNGTPPQALTCRSEAETHWLRNRYLHRSAKQSGDFEHMGMETRAEQLRLIIPDNDPDYLPPSLRPRPASAAATPAVPAPQVPVPVGDQ